MHDEPREELRSYLTARTQALRALLRELGPRELTREEQAAVDDLALEVRALLGDQAPAAKPGGDLEQD